MPRRTCTAFHLTSDDASLICRHFICNMGCNLLKIMLYVCCCRWIHVLAPQWYITTAMIKEKRGQNGLCKLCSVHASAAVCSNMTSHFHRHHPRVEPEDANENSRALREDLSLCSHRNYVNMSFLMSIQADIVCICLKWTLYSREKRRLSLH